MVKSLSHCSNVSKNSNLTLSPIIVTIASPMMPVFPVLGSVKEVEHVIYCKTSKSMHAHTRTHTHTFRKQQVKYHAVQTKK